MRKAVRIPILILLIAVGFTLIPPGVMSDEQNWDFKEFGKKLLANNPELQKASNLERAQVAFDAYMEFLTEQKAGITGTLGDSIGHTVRGTSNDPTKVLNCDQHTHNFQAIFEELAGNNGFQFASLHLTMMKEGLWGYNPLDVNAGHTAIMIRDDDGKIYVFDPWMHAMDRRSIIPVTLSDEGWEYEPWLVYDKWKTSPYRGMLLEDYEKHVQNEYGYKLDPIDQQFRNWQPIQRPEKSIPIKPIDDVIDECKSFCYGDEREAKWLVQNQYNGRTDPCYLDCINWGVTAMKEMVPQSVSEPDQTLSTEPTPYVCDGPEAVCRDVLAARAQNPFGR